MILKNINHDFAYHTQKIATMFFPLEKIRDGGESDIVIGTEANGGLLKVSASVFGRCLEKSKRIEENEDMALAVSLLLFSVLSELTGFKPPWGILYGVRPARLMHAKCDELGEAGAREFFLSRLAEEKKTDLALEVMKNENEIIKLSSENSCSLYVSVPFCPTRCSYCSFVSHSIENAGDLTEKYAALLCRELVVKAKAVMELGLRLETVYFGGGTPTSLSAETLDKILSAVNENFDLSTVREYTVEAGRPDTVTAEKLRVLKKHGVTRISINPQTFSDSVRERAGRHHTTKQTLDAFELARSEGFDNINSDFIAGLEGDTAEGFKASIEKAVSLGAESVTIHNLSLKSGAFLVTEKKYYDLNSRLIPSEMIDLASGVLKEAGYVPYYMYRQSKSLGNLENVGWCKKGRECLYNIFMMDETHSVISAGAGAVTMLKDQDSGHIERIYNFKYPYEYIKDFNEVLLRTDGIYSFYGA